MLQILLKTKRTDISEEYFFLHYVNILQELKKSQLTNKYWVGKPRNGFISAPLQETNGYLLLTFDWEPLILAVALLKKIHKHCLKELNMPEAQNGSEAEGRQLS